MNINEAKAEIQRIYLQETNVVEKYFKVLDNLNHLVWHKYPDEIPDSNYDDSLKYYFSNEGQVYWLFDKFVKYDHLAQPYKITTIDFWAEIPLFTEEL